MTASHADFGSRFAAWVIDAAILFSLQWLLVLVLSRQLQAAGMVERTACTPDSGIVCEGPTPTLSGILILLVIVLTLGWHAWFDGQVGATPGKRILGLRVVSASDWGQTIGLGPGGIRSLIRQAPWMWALVFAPTVINVRSEIFFGLLGLAFVPLIWAAVAPDGRGLHDRAVHSVVIPQQAAPQQAEPSALHDEMHEGVEGVET